MSLDDIAPDEIYKRQVYPDTTSFYLPAMKCCLEWVGGEHMMIGTDDAQRLRDPEGAIEGIRDPGERPHRTP